MTMWWEKNSWAKWFYTAEGHDKTFSHHENEVIVDSLN